MLIPVKQYTGEFAIAMEDGERLHAELLRFLKEPAEKVTLDFEGVKVFASPFLNAAIGQLLSSFKPEQLRDRLEFSHIPDHGRALIKGVVDNAKVFYGDPNVRKVVEEILRGREREDL